MPPTNVANVCVRSAGVHEEKSKAEHGSVVPRLISSATAWLVDVSVAVPVDLLLSVGSKRFSCSGTRTTMRMAAATSRNTPQLLVYFKPRLGREGPAWGGTRGWTRGIRCGQRLTNAHGAGRAGRRPPLPPPGCYALSTFTTSTSGGEAGMSSAACGERTETMMGDLTAG